VTTVLHVSPHADDEMIGPPATLLALRDAGARIVDLLLNLSASEHRARRSREAEAAHRRSGFELRFLDIPAPPARDIGSDPSAVEDSLAEALSTQLADLRPDLIVGPQPHDIHEAHELAGRAIRRALETQSSCNRWWMWGIWSDLLLPNLLRPFGEERLSEITDVLEAYVEEIRRNDYRLLVKGRGLVGATVGSERVFGFGTERASPEPYAELLTEVRLDGANWTLSGPAVLTGGVLPELTAVATATDWLNESTVGRRLAYQRMSQDRELFE
jgi:LmbE family N-acetylglucosaminyl deacetylase